MTVRQEPSKGTIQILSTELKDMKVLYMISLAYAGLGRPLLVQRAREPVRTSTTL